MRKIINRRPASSRGEGNAAGSLLKPRRGWRDDKKKLSCQQPGSRRSEKVEYVGDKRERTLERKENRGYL